MRVGGKERQGRKGAFVYRPAVDRGAQSQEPSARLHGSHFRIVLPGERMTETHRSVKFV